MPAKHQPDFSFLRHVPLRRVHLFTLVQIICLAVLWILKSTFLAIVFPVMVSVLLVASSMSDLHKTRAGILLLQYPINKSISITLIREVRGEWSCASARSVLLSSYNSSSCVLGGKQLQNRTGFHYCLITRNTRSY